MSYLSCLGLEFVLSVARSFGVQLLVFFCSGISVVFHTLGLSVVSIESLSLIHHHLICDLFVFYVDSLIG